MPLTTEQLHQIHDVIAVEDEDLQGAAFIAGANLACELDGIEARFTKATEALNVLRTLLQNLLEDDNYLDAAALIWGHELFDPRPQAVRDIFRCLNSHHKLLIQGSSAVGKSYSAAAWHYLDWRRDPSATAIKVAAPHEDHLKSHIFAHIQDFHRFSAIPMDEEVISTPSDLYFGTKSGGRGFGFNGITFRHSQRASGSFKGFHPKPVKRQHPKFGKYSRIRILIDEASQIPEGPFGELNSVLSGIDELGSVKVTMAYNPESVGQTVVMMAMPEHGWQPEEMDTLYEWVSGKNWPVIRLDAATTENVIQRQTVFKSFQTYEGYLDLIKRGDSDYQTYGRGWPPVNASVRSVIPVNYVNEARGEAEFVGPIRVGASIDLAGSGGDTSTMAIFRFGLARSYRTADGEVIIFMDRLNPVKPKPRLVLQFDQIITLQKTGDSIKTAQEVMGVCNNNDIPAEMVAVDKSGAGTGVYNYLVNYFGDVLGVDWGTKATEIHVLAEDKDTAYDKYEMKISEMWFTAKRWLDPTVRAILINPIIPMNPLLTELTTRRWSWVKGSRQRVEKKDDWKSRNGGKSPDWADCFVQSTQLIRERSGSLPGINDHIAGEDSGETKRRDPSALQAMSMTDPHHVDGLDMPSSPSSNDPAGVLSPSSTQSALNPWDGLR